MLTWLQRAFGLPPRLPSEPEPFEPLHSSNAAGFQVAFQAGGLAPLRPPGRRFHAQLYLWTPLSVLRSHGKFQSEGDPYPAEKVPREFGAWVAEPAAPAGWEPPELDAMSDVGMVKPSTLLPFLQAFRGIVESGLEPAKMARRINLLHLAHPPWRRFVEALRRPSEIHPEGAPDLASVWFCPHLEATLKGVGPKLAAALYAAEFYTPQQVREASDEQLLNVHGMNKAILKRTRRT